MLLASLSTKGQVTIPKGVRDHLGLREGDQVEFFVRADGVVELRPLNVDLAAWFGRVRGRVARDPRARLRQPGVEAP